MKTAQQGRGLIPILILALVIIAVILFFYKGYPFNNSSSNISPSVSNIPATAPQSKGVVELMLDPADATATANQTFNISVKVDTKTETISAIDLHLNYDPNYLEATAVNPGTFLPVVLTPSKITSGGATIVVAVNPSAPQKGIGIVAVATFKAKKSGMTKIMVENSTLVAAIGKTSSVLGSTSGTAVTIK